MATAGSVSHWKFVYTTATSLPKGSTIKFDLHSKGRPIDWQIPQTSLKVKSNGIWLEIPGAKPIEATLIPPAAPHWEASFEFVLPSEVKAGEAITVHLGSLSSEGEKNGNRCQEITQRRRFFHLSIDSRGKRDYKDPEVFTLDVRGNTLHHLRLIAPSLVSRNQRFDVLIRFEDIYGNLTSNAPEGTLIDLSYEHLRENLNWKLFVPETGVIALPNLYFNEPGIYRFQLRNLKTEQIFFSPPIKCIAEASLNLYWGQLHGESEKTDSAENVEAYLRTMRDDHSLQFCATSCFEAEEETTSDVWKGVMQQTAEFNEDDRFVSFLGFQWQGPEKQEGLRQMIYSKDAKPLLRSSENKNNALRKIYKSHTPKDLLSIFSFTMGKNTSYGFHDPMPEFERLAEVYNAWGSSECVSKEGNPRPIQGGKKGISEAKEGSLREALNRGVRFGFVAGGFDDRGPYAPLYDSDQAQYSSGMTAVLAKEHTRASLFEALYNRSCYATTGSKIVIGLFIAGSGMGTELDTKSKPGLEFNRHITGYALGTAPLKEVALIRNGTLYKKLPFQKDLAEFTLDDSELLSHIALDAPKEGFPFLYYYLRVVQEDGHVAWSSPIWVTLNASRASSMGLSSKKGKK